MLLVAPSFPPPVLSIPNRKIPVGVAMIPKCCPLWSFNPSSCFKPWRIEHRFSDLSWEDYQFGMQVREWLASASAFQQVRQYVVQVIFSVTFAFSCTMFELIIFEILGVLNSRWVPVLQPLPRSVWPLFTVDMSPGSYGREDLPWL